MTTDKPKKSALGRIMRAVLILILLVAVLVALAPTLFSGFIQGKIVEAMEESLDAKVTMEDFSFGWMSGSQIEGFSITRPGESEPALSVGKLTTDPSLSDILASRFIVEDIVAEDVTVRIKRDETGVDWQDIAKGPKKTGEKTGSDSAEIPDFLVRARVKNLRIVYSDIKLDQALDFPGMSVFLEASQGADLKVKVTGPFGLDCDLKCQLFDGDRLLPSDRITATGTLAWSDLQLFDYQPHLGQYLSGLSGTVNTNYTLNYGPQGAIRVVGKTQWKGLVAKTSAGGVASTSGTIDNTVVMAEGQPRVVNALINLSDVEIVGMPNQKKAVPCGAGVVDIKMAGDLLTLSQCEVAVPGGKFSLSGDYAMGDQPSRGMRLDANTDLAIWSTYFEGIPDLGGKVQVGGLIPGDMTRNPIDLKVLVDALKLTGGPLGEKSYNCGKTTLDLQLTRPQTPEGPQDIIVKSRSRMWQVDLNSSLRSKASAAFGMLGQAKIKGNCDMEQFLAPFTDSRGQGRVSFDFLAGLEEDKVQIQNATIRGPGATAQFSGQVGRRADGWGFMFDGKDVTYQRGDGIGIVMPKLLGRGTWNEKSHAVQGRISIDDVRTVGGQRASMKGGAVLVDFDGSVDQEKGRYQINFGRLNLAGFQGKGGIDYANETGLGKLSIVGEADYAELSSRWLRLYDPQATGRGKGPVVLEIDPKGGNWSQASGRIDLQIPGLTTQGFDLADLVIKGTMSNGKGKITQGGGRLNDGTVKLTGDIDFTGENMVFNTNAEMKRVKLVKEWQPAIARVIPLFAGIGVTAEGFINMNLTADGVGDTWDSIQPRLNGDGSLGLGNGRIVGSPILRTFGLALGFDPNMSIRDINSAFQIKNGGIHQEGLMADFGTFQMKMGGITYLDGRLDYDIGFKPVSQNPNNWQRFASLVANDGFLPLKLRGTVDSPKPGLPDPAKLIEAGARKLLGDGIGNLLGGDKNKNGKSQGLGGLLKGLGGNKSKSKNDPKKKPADPIQGLLQGLGGNKKKSKDDAKKRSSDPLQGLLRGLGGKKKQKPDDKKNKKKQRPKGLGGLLQGLGGSGNQNDGHR